jgi:hypothetical protein
MHATAIPVRPVTSWTTPDQRKPWFKDYILTCGHRLVHRPLKRGPDGRMRVARRLGCPHCASLGPARAGQAQRTR